MLCSTNCLEYGRLLGVISDQIEVAAGIVRLEKRDDVAHQTPEAVGLTFGSNSRAIFRGLIEQRSDRRTNGRIAASRNLNCLMHTKRHTKHCSSRC